MVGALGSQPLGGHGGLAEPLPLCLSAAAPVQPLGVQLCRTLNFNGGSYGGRVVAASCFRRPEQERSKSNSSRAPGPSRALSQSR
jgi:hypothetical protein